MPSRAPDPLRLDVEELARTAGELRGRWPLDGFLRLAESIDSEGCSEPEVSWSAVGALQPRPGATAEVRLTLTAHATISMRCQRCLQPVALRLDVERPFRFAADEREAEQLDADVEEDVLVLTRELDLHTLLEDELVLALPLVPRHDVCSPPPVGTDPDEEDAGPFAALAALRRRGDKA